MNRSGVQQASDPSWRERLSLLCGVGVVVLVVAAVVGAVESRVARPRRVVRLRRPWHILSVRATTFY